MQITFEFLKVQWLHFAGVADKVMFTYFHFSGFYTPKISKISSSLTELLKIKMSSPF